MFHFKLLIPFAFIISHLISIIVPIDVTNITINSSSFGPYQANCPNQTINIEISTSKRIFSCHVTLYAGVSNSNYSYSRDYSSFDLAANAKKMQSIVLPTREYLTSNGMYIKLKITYDSPTEGSGQSVTHSYVIRPIEFNRNIRPEDYINTSCTINNASYAFLSSNLRSTNESFRFPDYIDYFNIDTYHRLDLESVSFIYVGMNTLTFSSAYLQIYDDDNVFPYINKNADGYFLIPLNINKTGNTCKFTFKNRFYVHPITAQMSFDPEEDFVLTRYFYLPKNGRENLLDKKMNIYLYGAGLASSNITWELTYMASQNLLGDCSDSDYCIVGEQKNG